MSKPFETVFVTMRPPRFGDHVGVVEEGHFKTVDDVVTLVDINGVQRFDKKGKPMHVSSQHSNEPELFNFSRRSGFNCRIWYPDLLDFTDGTRCADLNRWRSLSDWKICHGID
jgi:hypothetical protein